MDRMTKPGRPSVARVTVRCAGCGVSMERRESDVARSRTGRFACSRECRDKAAGKPRKGVTLTCEQCGADFYQRQSGADSRFCSRPCKDAWAGRNKVTKTCEFCGDEFKLSASMAVINPSKYCSRDCMGRAKMKRPLDRMHNGKPALLDHDGYVRLWEPSHPNAFSHGWVYEHRLVVEKILDRLLTSDEEVHHDDEVKHNNDPANLILLSKGQHSKVTGLANWGRLSTLEAKLREYEERFGPLALTVDAPA